MVQKVGLVRDGNRLQKSNGKIYWYGAGTEILDESDANGNFTNEYVFFGGKRIAMRTVSSGTIYYYAEDMLGSSRTIVQAGQTSPCYDADFLPFGKEVPVTNTCSQPYKFEGKERDTETLNDDFGARYFSWRLGRWLSADWSSVPAPVPYATLSNPQTLNLYAMVSDNPESFADLDGHCTIDVDCVRYLFGFWGPTVPKANNNTTATTATSANTPANSGAAPQQSQQTGVQQAQQAQNTTSQQQNGTSSTEAQNEQHQYDLVVERTNKLLGGAKDSDGDVINAADHISSACGLVGGNCEFKIKNGDADSDFRSALNKSLGEADGDTGAHGGLSAPTHRVGFSTSLHHDNDALHVDHYNGAKFPLGTLLHAIVDVGVGHLPYYGSNHAFSYAGVQ